MYALLKSVTFVCTIISKIASFKEFILICLYSMVTTNVELAELILSVRYTKYKDFMKIKPVVLRLLRRWVCNTWEIWRFNMCHKHTSKHPLRIFSRPAFLTVKSYFDRSDLHEMKNATRCCLGVCVGVCACVAGKWFRHCMVAIIHEINWKAMLHSPRKSANRIGRWCWCDTSKSTPQTRTHVVQWPLWC